MATMFQRRPMIPPIAPGGFQYQDPMQQLGELERIQYLQQNNPEALMSIAQGLMSGDMGAGFAGAGQAMSAYRKDDMKRQEQAHEREQAKQFYLAQGLSEAEANAAAANENIGSSYLRRKELEEEYGLKTEYKRQFPDETGGSSGTHGNLVNLQGPNGEAGVGVVRKSDGRVIDSRTGQEVGSDWQILGPYDTSQQRQLGKTTADATMQLPQVEMLTRQAIDVSDQVINHPMLEANVGWLDAQTPAIRPGSVQFQALKEQMTGQAFLSAFEGLKGGGAITEAEGLAATKAKIAKMDGSDPEAFKQAIREYQYWLQEGLKVARGRASMQPNIIGDRGQGGGGAYTPPPSGRVLSVRPKG